MPYGFNDLLETLQADTNHRSREFIGSEFASIQVATEEDIKKMFPGVRLDGTGSVAYLPMRMCHSLPHVNKRGRCFTPQVLANSYASAFDSLIDVEHLLEANYNNSDRDLIVGHIKAARFDYSPAGEIASMIPAEPIPMYALGALYLRHKMVPKIIEEHFGSNSRWQVSMECYHRWEEASLYYDNKFIPIQEACDGMLRCIKKGSVQPYQGKPLAAAMGGADGQVDFWGLGLTKAPADGDAEILNIITASSRELASTRKNFLPLRFEKFMVEKGNSEKSLELANDFVDRRTAELASIGMLGKTDPAEDGHVHDVLTDGTILPAHGHQHCVANWNLVRGTKPKWTGRTDSHHEYYRDSMSVESRSLVHIHTINIELRGKATAVPEGGDDDLANLLGDDPMKLKEILDRLGKLESKVSTGNSGDKTPALTEFLQELASLRGEIASLSKTEEIQEMVRAEIASAVEAGTLVKKEDHESKLAAAVKVEHDKAEEERKKAERIQARLETVSALGVSLDYEFEDQPGITIDKKVRAIGFDDAGEQLFQAEVRAIKSMVEVEKMKQAAAEAPEVTTGAAATAANVETKPATKKKLLVGGPSGTETASSPAGGNGVAKKIGRHAILSGK